MVHIFDLKATGYLNHDKLRVAESEHMAKKSMWKFTIVKIPSDRIPPMHINDSGVNATFISNAGGQRPNKVFHILY